MNEPSLAPAGTTATETAAGTTTQTTAETAARATAGTAAGTPEMPTLTCPECGEPVPNDTRFVVWCAACGWNTDPLPPKPPRGRVEAFRRRLAGRHGEQLHAELAAEGVRAARHDAAGVAAYAVAWAVHLTTVLLAVAGVLLVVLGWSTGFLPVCGALALAGAVVLRPRLGRRPKDAHVLDRSAAPRLYALLDRVADETGTRPADLVVVDAETNASVSEYGPRRRRVLRLGLPLWHILTPQERVALIGHEFGHYANGDLRQGLVIGTALDTLASWYAMLLPTAPLRRGPVEAAANALLALPRFAVLGVLRVLDHFTLRATQRAEYRADALAAAAGSSQAAAGLFDRLSVLSSVDQELRRQAILARTRAHGADPREIAAGLWTRLADHANTVTPHELDRLRRVGVLHGHSTDATHPPTHLRRALVTEAPQLPAAVTLDAAEAAAIDAELAAVGERLARETLRDQRL